jgi:putative spermidine/putrescine transport system permease protein
MTTTATRPAAATAPTTRARRRAPRWLFLLPGLLLLAVGLGLPLLQTFRVSLWSQTGFVLERTSSLALYRELFTDPTFWGTTWTTLYTTAIVMACSLLIAFPVAYFITFHVPQRWQIPLFFVAVIPFWTSYLIRMVAYIPVLGRGGVGAQIWELLRLPGSPDFLLFTEFSQLFVMSILYALFAVGPIVFSLSRIDPSVLEAAGTLGARPARAFRDITLGLAKPGIVTGAIFVGILVMQEYTTPLIMGGGKTPMLGNEVLARSSFLQWPAASARALLLSLFSLLLVAALLRISDIRGEVG